MVFLGRLEGEFKALDDGCFPSPTISRLNFEELACTLCLNSVSVNGAKNV